jgi:hypothetical protein
MKARGLERNVERARNPSRLQQGDELVGHARLRLSRCSMFGRNAASGLPLVRLWTIDGLRKHRELIEL